MSTLISLVLAAVLNILGAEIPPEEKGLTKLDIHQVENRMCNQHSEILASTCIIKNEQLFNEKGIR